MKLDRTSMLYGTLILTGTSIVSQFLGFVYRILLSRLIGAEVMGLYQLIMPVFSVIMALTAVGLTVAVSNLSSQYHARGNRAAIAQVLRRCLAVFLLLFAAVAAVVVLLYDPISVYLLGDARTQLGLLLLLPCILLTGVSLRPGAIGAGCFDRATGRIRFAMARQEPAQFPGTGDLFASVVLGAMLRGEPLETAAQRAAEFVQRCAAHTLALGTPVLEGVQFEPLLGELMQR